MSILLFAEGNTAEHAVAIKPMGVSAEVLIGNRISTIANVFAIGEFVWNGSAIRTCC